MNCNFQRLATGMAFVLCCFLGTALPAEVEMDSDPDCWKFGGSMYLWAAGVKGTDAAGNDIDVSFSDTLEDLDGGFMGGIAARKGKWTILADLMGLSIHQETSSTVDSVKTDVDVKLKAFMSTFGVAYRVIDDEDLDLDLLVGGRYFKMDLDVTVESEGSKSKYSDTEYVLDGIIGAQAIIDLSERWYLSCYADVGTGDSELTWQVWPGVGYRLENIDVVAGYRYLAWKTDDGDTIDDLSFSGPMFGVKFRF